MAPLVRIHRRRLPAVVVVLAALLAGSVACAQPSGIPAGTDPWAGLKMWYNAPNPDWGAGSYGGVWEKALPFGNGRMGARNTGGIQQERLSFNENTLWTGGPRDYTNPKVKEITPEIRKAMFAGDLQKADDLCHQITGGDTASYLPMGDLYIDMAHSPAASAYHRELDLNRAVETVRYMIDGVTYTRELFASYPDKVIVAYFSCDRPGKLAFTVRMDSQLQRIVQLDGNGGIIVNGTNVIPKNQGDAPSNDANAMTFQSRVKVILQGGGTATADGKGIRVQNATYATLILAGSTSFNGWNKTPGTEGKDPVKEVAATLSAASALSYIPDKPGMWARLNDGDMVVKTLGTGHEPNVRYPWRFLTSFSSVYEVLVQSHRGYIELLPALPASWPEGRVRGLRTRGGFDVAMEWKNGRLIRAFVRNATDAALSCKVKYGEKFIELRLAPCAAVPLNGSLGRM